MSIFSQVQMKAPKRNKFKMPHDRKMSMSMGRLYPVYLQEVVPNDSFNVNTQFLMRFQPMLAPIMHRVDVKMEYFYVPNRLVWSGWETFITGGENGDESAVFPYLNLTSCTEKSLADYMGIPTSANFTDPLKVSAIPVAIYNLIWNEFYRDQTLQAKLPYKLVDGLNPENMANNFSTGPCAFRAWEKDYFTSALPWPQRGEQATIPLGTTAPVTFKTTGLTGDNVLETDGTVGVGALSGDPEGILVDGDGADATINNSRNLLVDLSQASAATINSLRNAYALQRWLEKNARGGGRYTEVLLSHFNVHNNDLKLMRPQFLSSGKTNISVSEVLQMSSTDETSPQGNMSGHGITTGSLHAFKDRFEEHGYVIGIMSVVPKPAYMDGLHKSWSRFDKLDYLWPDFAHLGEQEIKNQELFIDQDENVRDDTFGYTPRYAEYKYMPSSVHGEMRTSLKFWQMAREFAETPPLSEEFIVCDPAKDIFAVTDPNVDPIVCHVFNNVSALRPLPYFGTPQP